MSPRLLILACAALLVAAASWGAYAALRDNQADAERNARVDALDVLAAPSNTTRGTLVLVPHARVVGASINLSLVDPTNGTFASFWNATLEEGREARVPLDQVPELFLVIARFDETGAPTALKWVWQGRAHLVIADTPAGLARELQEARP